MPLPRRRPQPGESFTLRTSAPMSVAYDAWPDATAFYDGLVARTLTSSDPAQWHPARTAVGVLQRAGYLATVLVLEYADVS